MDVYEHESKLKEILSKFSPEMQKQYYLSPLFTHIATALAMGTDPYKVIEDLVVKIEEAQEKMKELLLYGPFPQLIIAEKDTIDKIRKEEEKKRKKKS